MFATALSSDTPAAAAGRDPRTSRAGGGGGGADERVFFLTNSFLNERDLPFFCFKEQRFGF